MTRLRPISLVLIASAAVAWALPAYATGNCANGTTLYNKTNASNPIACSNSNCHGSGVNKNSIQNAAANAGLIDQALDGPPGDPAMQGIRSALGLTASDLDDLATWIFYAPACPVTAPILHAAPAPLVFGATAPGSTSAPTVVGVTNAGSASATGIGFSNSNGGEFAVSANTCAGATVAVGAACSFSVAFKPAAAGSRNATLSLTYNGKTLLLAASGTGTTGTSSATITVVEYHNADFDHYFITPVEAEIALLDAHAAPFQAWSRTGLSFNGYVNATAPAASVAICRFFNSSFAPKSSHFYAPHGLGCEATIAGFPDWKLEDDRLFNAMLPDVNGVCPAGTIPVYRLYNSGMGGAPNHRFVTSLAERQNMISQGFVAEGSGIGVGMCVPP